MKTIEAQVIDATLLRLLEPIQLPKFTRVVISVLPAQSNERAAWLQASAGWLSQAYSDDEPEYSIDLVKTLNPDFEQ
jgi:hypothetical protein